MFFKGENFFHIPPYHTEFFGIPLLLTTLVFRRQVKYGQYDEMINVYNRKLKTKVNQRFTDFSISGIKRNTGKL